MGAKMPIGKPKSKREAGSAMTEAAIIIPVLAILVFWASAMTDIIILKVKAQEAARFALWELTVFRSPAEITTDLKTRFQDLKSPESVADGKTNLLLYPKSTNLTWNVAINPRYQEVKIGGAPQSGNSNGLGGVLGFVSQIAGFLGTTVDAGMRYMKFNTYGSGSVIVSLGASHTGSRILNGGDFAGHISGGQDMRGTSIIDNLLFNAPVQGERPMRLVFDSWKAWPKPAMYTTDGATGNLANPALSPSQSYPVVESMVSQQVNQIAFFGLNQISFFNQLNNFMGQLLSSAIGQALVGGDAPTFFTTSPMDHRLNDVSIHAMPVGHRSFPIGPVTILPVEPPTGSAPGAGLFTNRLGDLGSAGYSVQTVDEYKGMGAGSDQSRYTVPYRINTKYWTRNGGTNWNSGSMISAGSNVSPVAASIATKNNYVKTYACRGHFFAGATQAQISDPTKRFLHTCPY
jgi:hypothetical protein